MDTFTEFHFFSTSLPTDFKEEGEITKIRTFGKPWYPYMIALEGTGVVAAILLNLLPIVAYFKFDSLKTPTTLLICNQSFADVLAAIQSLFYLIFNLTEWGFNFASAYKYICLFVIGNVLLSYTMSVVNLFIITLERFIAVLLPYKYYDWVTDSTMKKALIAVWTSITIIASLPIFGLNTWDRAQKCYGLSVLNYIYMTYMVLINVVAILILTALANFIIAYIAFKKSKVSPASINEALADINNSTTLHNKRDFKITKMLLMVVGIFYICWAPYIIITGLLLFPSESWLRSGPPESVLIMHEVTKGMFLWGSGINPIIYAWKNIKYRTAFRKLLRLKVNNEND